MFRYSKEERDKFFEGKHLHDVHEEIPSRIRDMFYVLNISGYFDYNMHADYWDIFNVFIYRELDGDWFRYECEICGDGTVFYSGIREDGTEYDEELHFEHLEDFYSFFEDRLAEAVQRGFLR